MQNFSTKIPTDTKSLGITGVRSCPTSLDATARILPLSQARIVYDVYAASRSWLVCPYASTEETYNILRLVNDLTLPSVSRIVNRTFAKQTF